MVFINIQIALCVCVLVGLQCVVDTNAVSEGPIKGPCVNETKPCGDCGPRIQVTLRIENNNLQPFFNVSITLRERQRQLIYFLQDAADIKEEFRFSADFYGGIGYLITSINKQQVDSTHYWGTYDGEGNGTPCGVSAYIPQDQETVSFIFTKSSSIE